jgi:hypothetical protein
MVNSNSQRPLTTEEIIASITDEMVQAEGYPNREVYLLARQLGSLAGEWRETKEAEVVKRYHDLFHKLLALGWNPVLIAIDEMLPDELMPEFPEIVVKQYPQKQK